DHVVDDDAGLLTGQFENNRLADPVVAVGDRGDFVLQRHDQLSISHAGLLRASMHGAGTLRAVSNGGTRQRAAEGSGELPPLRTPIVGIAGCCARAASGHAAAALPPSKMTDSRASPS